MRLKMAVENVGLCGDCNSGHVTTDERGRTVVNCDRSGMRNAERVKVKVTSCSSYYSRSMTSRREYEQIAWIINADPKKGKAGFTIDPPSKEEW